MDSKLDKHDWDAVREALEDLQTDTEEKEPWAERFIAAIQEVLNGLPTA